MSKSMIRKAAILWAAFLLLGQFGCAPKVRAPVLARQELSKEKIALVIKSGNAENMRWTGPAGRGVVAGGAIGSVFCLSSGMGLLLCLPMTLVGVVAGGAAGALAPEEASKDKGAQAVLLSRLKERGFSRLLEADLLSFGKAAGCSIRSLGELEEVPGGTVSCRTLSEEGTGLVLELSERMIYLEEADLVVMNPPLTPVASVRAALVRTHDGTRLDDRVVAVKGTARTRDEWVFDGGSTFYDELGIITKELAEKIVEDLFTSSPPPLEARLRCPMMKCTAHGLKPLYPPVRFGDTIFMRTIDSLQPTMRWEPYPGENVTYDLKIFVSPRGSTRSDVYGSQLVYSRQGLPQASHAVETPLQSKTSYRWTVRARFTSGGLTRMTRWAEWSSWLGEKMGEARQYYLFRTK